MTVQRVTEAVTATATPKGPGRVLLTIITPGQGSSGYYTPEVLERAATDKVFPRGTQGMVDHPTLTEGADRPEGSLHNLALVLTEDARWDGEALVAEARVRSTYRDLVDEFHDFIGVSISAAAEIGDNGVIERLIPDPFNRVDLVTVPGRGGRVAAVLESARAREALASDLRDRLIAALRAADVGYYVDHDEQHVIYEPWDSTPTNLMRATYDQSPIPTLGTPEPVTRTVTYNPTPAEARPADATTPATESQEDTMAKTEIDEQELHQLRESASRAETLQAENTALKEAAEAAAKSMRERALADARAIVAEHFGEDAPAFIVRAAEAAAGGEDFDTDVFRTEVTEAAAALTVDPATPNVGAHVTETATGRTITDADIVAIY
ncbi:hypothetical protein [Micrococcus luteus]|uniref:hypothetical protein n=1 Tax=Micrococcus luteus TaxID=1270 RepID=UPI0023022D7F|nr:hypothetical protein [Micrococcus luteus]